MMLMDFLKDVPKYGEHWHGIAVRKTYPELSQMVRDSYMMYPQTGAKYYKQEKKWVWPNGATQIFRNLDRWEDAQSYQGHSYSHLTFSEAGNYASPDVYFAMMATVRSGSAHIPTARIRLDGNPGGPGHHWLKNRFVDPAPKGYRVIKEEGETRERMFIPATVTDNKILMLNDPHYIENLKRQGSEELVRAWLYGDWDVQVASFFGSDFKVSKHVVPQMVVPEHWTKYAGLDWGSSHPFCYLNAAVSDGTAIRDLQGRWHLFPVGALIIYREWYGMKPGRPNVGIQINNEDMAAGIRLRTRGEEIRLTVTDSLPFQFRGGPKMAEVFAKCGVPLRRGDDSRVPGWAQIRTRLQGKDGVPMLYICENCIHTIRTLPTLQADRHNLEDIDSDGEDHAADTLRLICMTRPMVTHYTSTEHDYSYRDLLKDEYRDIGR